MPQYKRLNDIPQFTRGTYEVDVMLSRLKQELESYRKTDNLELNPDFQRGNVWTEQQQIAYVEFFLRGGQSAKTIYFNCGAWNERVQDSDIPQMVCVDGLQRLTALTRFLDDEIPAFGTKFSEYEDRDKLRCHFALKFNINDLPYKKDVLKWYLEMNSGGTVHSQQELDRVGAMLAELEDAQPKSKPKPQRDMEI